MDLVVPGEWLTEFDGSKKNDAAGYARAAVALAETVAREDRMLGTRMIAEAAASLRTLDDITLHAEVAEESAVREILSEVGMRSSSPDRLRSAKAI